MKFRCDQPEPKPGTRYQVPGVYHVLLSRALSHIVQLCGPFRDVWVSWLLFTCRLSEFRSVLCLSVGLYPPWRSSITGSIKSLNTSYVSSSPATQPTVMMKGWPVETQDSWSFPVQTGFSVQIQNLYLFRCVKMFSTQLNWIWWGELITQEIKVPSFFSCSGFKEQKLA